MKTKEQIEMEICEVIQTADNESIELDDFTLGQLTDYCYELQKVKNNVVLADVNNNEVAVCERKWHYKCFRTHEICNSKECGKGYKQTDC